MLKVLNAGIYASIQDLGRFGYSNNGVPVSGVMDAYSAKLANLMLGNNENDAVLEITSGASSFEFLKETIICISGADFNSQLNDMNIINNHPVKVKANSILKFANPKFGVRAYLAVKGGFLNKKVLNSRSFFKEITKIHRLKKDDEILYNELIINQNHSFSSVKINKEHFQSKIVEVYKGPEYELLNKNKQQFLEKTHFTISKENNRMGYKLDEMLENNFSSMLTSAVLVGTVQLTPSGKLIVLMRDCGVTGGYPRILQLTDDSINRLAQKTTKDTFRFKLLDLDS